MYDAKRLNPVESTFDKGKLVDISMQWLKNEIEAVYDRFEQHFFSCALGITQNPSTAEEAVQEAVLKCLCLEEKPKNLRAYMFRCVRNAAIDMLRRKGKENSIADHYIFTSSSNSAELAEEKLFREEVVQALQRLSNDERETIVQHLYADLTFQEIAHMRERPMGTVTSWYRRGLDRLRQNLESSNG